MCNKVNTCVCASLFYVCYTSVICVCAARCRQVPYILVMSLTRLHTSHVPLKLPVLCWRTQSIYTSLYMHIYTYIYESCLLYIYIRVMSLTRLHMSHVSYILIWASRPLYIYIWVMSFIHLHTSRVSHTSIYESCPRNGSNPAGSFSTSVSPLPTSGSIPVCHHSETSSGHDWLRCHLWENPI